MLRALHESPAGLPGMDSGQSFGRDALMPEYPPQGYWNRTVAGGYCWKCGVHHVRRVVRPTCTLMPLVVMVGREVVYECPDCGSLGGSRSERVISRNDG